VIALAQLARLVRLVAGVVCLIIVLAVLLRLLGANASNDVVKAIRDAARWVVGPFRDVFSVENLKLREVLNWGLAAVVYAGAAAVITSLLERGTAVGPTGRRVRRPRRAA